MNLRAKTSLFITAFIVAIVFTHGYIHLREEEREQSNRLLVNGLSFATLTADNVSSNYEKYYHKAFYSFLNEMRELYTLDENLYEIKIADVNGNILMNGEELETSSPVNVKRIISLSDWEHGTLMSVLPEYRYTEKNGKELLEISYPVLLQGGVHKHNVFYYFHFDLVDARLDGMKQATSKLTLLFVAIGFIGASLFSYGLTRNLGKLVVHANLMAKGDLHEPIEIRSGDEMGDLAAAFEFMRNELKKKNEEIESYNKKLEEKVKERTAELEGLTTKLKNNNVILQRANEKLLELDKLKSEFLANTSHELRTPLTSIIGYSQCVLAELDGPLPNEHKGNIKKILDSGKDLLSLINRILDFSKLESGEISILRESVIMKEVVEEAVTTVRPMSEEKGLSLITNFDPDIPEITGDRMRIKQALLNILANAVKFTEEGFVMISVSRNNGDLQISIRDTGIGIPKEEHQSIFEAFRQVDGSVNRKYGGSGLGLSISRKLIELHSGRLWLESEEGEGTTFTFTLPTDKKEVSDVDEHS